MKKLILFLCCFSTFCFSNEFFPYKDIYNNNKFFYEHYLSTDFELNDLARLHLLGLRLMIDIRLRDSFSIYRDSDEIYEMIFNEDYLREEFTRRYSKKND